MVAETHAFINQSQYYHYGNFQGSKFSNEKAYMAMSDKMTKGQLKHTLI